MLQHSYGEMAPAACVLDVAGETLRVTYAERAAGAEFGSVTVDVLSGDGAVRQTMQEPDVSQYMPVTVEDIDGDGRADLLIPRRAGNVNTEWGVWIFSGARAAYERIGVVSGVSVGRTEDGYISVPARSSAAAWETHYYRLDQSGLHLIAAVRIEGEEDVGGAIDASCQIIDASGLATVGLTPQAAQAKFCAEPGAMFE